MRKPRVFFIVTLTCALASMGLFGCQDAATSISGSTTFDEVETPALVPEPQPQPQPEPVASQTALLSFAGDCTLAPVQDTYDFYNYYDQYGAAYFFAGVYDVFANDDLTVVNMEGTLTNSTEHIDKGEPPVFYFRAPPEYAQILTEGSVEAVTLANNHSYDYGDQGYVDTQNTLTEYGVDYFAYNETLVREVNGIKFGFFGLAFDSDPDRIHALMDQLYSQGAEVIIAFNHDGWERDYTPDSAQVDGAHTAIDYGASAVFFSHPHVLQGIEEYNGGFIAYSMGNFCFGGNSNPSDKDTMIVQLKFTRNGEGFDHSYTIIPCSLSSTWDYNDYQPTVLEGDERQRVMDKILGMSYL